MFTNPTVLDEEAKAYLEMMHEQVLASNSKVMGEFMGCFASVTSDGGYVDTSVMYVKNDNGGSIACSFLFCLYKT
jgi:hypothetical protein